VRVRIRIRARVRVRVRGRVGRARASCAAPVAPPSKTAGFSSAAWIYGKG